MGAASNDFAVPVRRYLVPWGQLLSAVSEDVIKGRACHEDNEDCLTALLAIGIREPVS